MSDGAEFFLFFVLPMLIFLACFFCWLPVKLDDGSLGAPVVLPHFPYAQQAVAEPAACAICLDELRHGELCSEVPACRHIFHESCIRAWTKKMNSCPLCRAKIVPGGAPAAADGMV